MMLKKNPADFTDGRGTDYVTRDRANLESLGFMALMLVIGILIGSAIWPAAALAGPVKVVRPNCEVRVSRIGQTNTITVLVKGTPARVTATIHGTHRPNGVLKNAKRFNLGKVKTPYVTSSLGVIWVARGDINGIKCVAWDGMY